MPRRRASANVGAGPQIAKHSATARADALLKERARLLREVQKKRRAIESTKAEALRVSDEGLRRMRPVMERKQQLATALEALFQELLRKGRLPARARKEVQRLRSFLIAEGLLEVDVDVDDDAEEVDATAHDAAPNSEPRPWEAPPRHARGREHRPTAPEVAGARQVGQERRSLRDIFRALAKLVHPDQARHDDERERRTEVMKQVTRAYEDGDLARLVELESSWQRESVIEGGDPEARCQELERLNRELLAQLRAATNELRDAKRERRDAEDSCPPEGLVRVALAELEQVAAVAEHLERLRDGKISPQDFTRGPFHS